MANSRVSGMVVAREACVVFVGARPPAYEQIEVVHNRTGERVKMNKDLPSDPGSEGTAYTFRQYQKVPKTHEAVKTSPGSFISIDELTEAELDMVRA